MTLIVEPRPAACRAPGSHAGTALRQARLARGMSLGDVALQTKIKADSLRLIDDGEFGALPAEVFVRGFVRAYARSVGADGQEASRLLDSHYAATRAPAVMPPRVAAVVASHGAGGERRSVGVVLVALVILIAATLTLSLLLRSASPTEGGLSRLDPSALAAPRAARS